jgi:hypothetical protein
VPTKRKRGVAKCHPSFLKVEIMKTFKTPPQGTTVVSEKELRLQEFNAKQYLSDMECYTFLKTAHLADMVFSKNPSKIVWAKFVKRFGQDIVDQAYRYWLSYAR